MFGGGVGMFPGNLWYNSIVTAEKYGFTPLILIVVLSKIERFVALRETRLKVQNSFGLNYCQLERILLTLV
jgi:hypothetical protein